MNKFKVGDTVRRISKSRLLVLGGVYEVEGLSESDGWVQLKGQTDHFDPSKFELVEDTSKRHPHYDVIIAWAKGAEIEYKTNDGGWSRYLTYAFPPALTFRVKPQTNSEKEKLVSLISDMSKKLEEAKARLKGISDE